MDQFFVVLPSDSSMNYFPDNTVARYKTKLVHPICIEGDYEVALTELIYPLNFHNFVPKDKCSLHYPPTSMDISQIGMSCYNLVNWELQSGYFENVNKLIDHLNKDLNKALKTLYKVNAGDPSYFTYKNERMNFLLTGMLDLGREDVTHFVNYLAEEAGMSKNLIDQLKIGKNEPYVLPDPYSENRLMYVYSDIVRPNLVGDVQTPLLRVVALKGKRGEMMSEVFHNPYYVPVARRGFDTIEININTELGEPMPFVDGKSVAVLHFRK